MSGGQNSQEVAKMTTVNQCGQDPASVEEPFLIQDSPPLLNSLWMESQNMMPNLL